MLYLTDEALGLLVIVVLGMGVVTWVLTLAGIAATQAQCPGIANDYGQEVDCSDVLSYSWWILFFQMAIGGAIIYLFIKQWPGRMRWAAVAMAGLFSVWWMDQADSFMHLRWDNVLTASQSTAVGVAASGCILLFLSNFLLIWLLLLVGPQGPDAPAPKPGERPVHLRAGEFELPIPPSVHGVMGGGAQPGAATV